MKFKYYLELCQHYVATLYKFQNNLGDVHTLSKHISNLRYKIITEFRLPSEVIDNIFSNMEFSDAVVKGDMTKYYEDRGCKAFRQLMVYKYNEFENHFKLKEKLNGDNIRINAQD